MASVTQLSLPRALLLSATPLIFAIPALFYFGVLKATLEFLLFTLFVAVPLSISIYLVSRTKSIDLVNKHYLKVLIFYIIGSAIQLHLLGIRAIYFIEFKAGVVANIDGSEFKIPVLAGLLAWAKFVLIVTRAESKRVNYVAYAMIVLFEAVANFKRSALIFLCMPLLLKILLERRSMRRFYLLVVGLVLGFAAIGNFREGGEDPFARLEPLSSNSALNWLFTYTSINYHVAYQKFLAASSFDVCVLFNIITYDPACESDFSLFGFNAPTYVGNFVEAGFIGMFLLQLALIYFALVVRSLSPISRGLYLYLLTLYVLNLFGAYILERNEFLLAIGWVFYEVIKRHFGRRTATRNLRPSLISNSGTSFVSGGAAPRHVEVAPQI